MTKYFAIYGKKPILPAQESNNFTGSPTMIVTCFNNEIKIIDVLSAGPDLEEALENLEASKWNGFKLNKAIVNPPPK